MAREECIKCDAHECQAVLPYGAAQVDKWQWLTIVKLNAWGAEVSRVDLCPEHARDTITAMNKAAGLLM